jgi:hypothetical protein
VNSGYAIKDSTTGGKNAKSSSSFLKSSGRCLALVFISNFLIFYFSYHNYIFLTI